MSNSSRKIENNRAKAQWLLSLAESELEGAEYLLKEVELPHDGVETAKVLVLKLIDNLQLLKSVTSRTKRK